MDWNGIIMTLVTAICGGGITGLFLLRSRVKKSNVEADKMSNEEQADRINLGNLYVNNMLEMLNKINKSNEKRDENDQLRHNDILEISGKIDALTTEVNSIRSELSCVVSYLNGGYKKYKEDSAFTVDESK